MTPSAWRLPLAWVPDGGPPSAAGFARPWSPPPGRPGDLLTDSGDSHIAAFAPTGAGKSRNLLVPILLTDDSSAIVPDFKGELAAITARHRREAFGHEVAVIDPYGVTGLRAATYNPLSMLSADDPDLVDDALEMAGQLIDPFAPSKEVYWDDSSQGVVSGQIVQAVTRSARQDRTMGYVWRSLHGDDVIYDLAVQLDTAPNLHPYTRAQIGGFISLSADITRSCILSVVRQHLRCFGSELIQRSLSSTSFDLGKLRDGGPITIYLVLPPDKLRSHGALFRLWITSLLNIITRRRAAPRRPTLLLLDEVAQLGPSPQVRQAVTLMRGYGLRCMLLLQSYAQLMELYPKEHETLLENCGTLVTFGHTAMSMSNRMAAALGDISAEALFRMRPDEVAVRTPGEPTRVFRRLDYLTQPFFAGRFDPHPMHARGR